jgi:hypothetical protein
MKAHRIDQLPMLTAREAYLALVQFLRMELDLCGPDSRIDLVGLLAEMDPESTGTSADPGGVEQFVDAVLRVKSEGGNAKWSSTRSGQA